MFAFFLVAGSLAGAQTANFGSYESTVVPSGLHTPHNVAVDSSGNVYVPDTWGHRVLKETPSAGGYTQTTLGSGWQEPWGIAIDAAGSLYITDTGLNQLIRLTPSGSSYVQSTIGTGFNSPQGLAVDSSGNVYIADALNNQIVKETLSAGTYSPSTIVSGLNQPAGIAVDARGNLYIADTNNYRVLIEAPSSGTYIQSQMSVPGLDMPFGIAVDQYANVYVADTYHNKILVETLSASGTYTQSSIPTSQLYYPDGVAVDRNGNVYIADSDNARVIEETTAGVNFGSVNVGSASASLTLSFVIATAGTLGPVAVRTAGVTGLDFLNAGSGTCKAGTAYAAAATCTVNVTFAPEAPGMRRGAAVLENSSGSVIATAYLVGVGVGSQVNFLPGVQKTVLATGLNGPFGVAADFSGNVYLADAHNYRVLKETPSGSGYTAATVVGGNQYGPYGLALDGAGNLYVADYNNSRIVKVAPSGSTWVQTTIVTGLHNPYAVAVDGSGNLYIADTNNQRILKETLTVGGYMQSVVPTSNLNDPYGVAVDASGNVYLVDTWHNRALKETWTPAGYTESTLGSGLAGPGAIAVDGNGNVFIADTYNKQIVKETPSGNSYVQSTVVSGNLSLPLGVAVDGNGNVVVGDYAGNQVIRQNFSDPPTLSFAAATVGSVSSDSPKTVALENIGNAALNFPIPSSGNNPSVAANFVLAGSSSSDCTVLNPASSAIAVLAPGASCLLPISFEPVAAGSISGSLTVTDTALNAPPPGYAAQSIALSGAATSATPVITWGTQAAIAYGTPLSAVQLNATSTVAGAFAYTPALGTVLGAGPHILSVTFTPTDSTDYTTATSTVTLTVNPAAPAITWPAPAAIAYGAALTAAQLNATSTVPGTFAYTPALGTVLSAGPHILSVTFTPTDTTDYAAATSTVTLTVSPAAPAIAWPAPAAIPYGTALTAAQLNATSTVPGAFAYTPALGTVLSAGPHTLSLTFAPTDSTNYTTATSTVVLTVNQAAQTITFAALASPVTYGVGPIPLTAAGGNSGLPVTFTIAGPAVLNGANLVVTGAGTVSVTAGQTGNANYAAAVPVQRTLLVNQAASTTAVSAASLAPSQQQPDLLTATVTGPGILTGTVAFSAAGSILCSAALSNGVASCSYVPQAPGSTGITALYSGDGNHTSSSASLSLTVQPLYDVAISLHTANTQLVYPGATNLSVCVTAASKIAATGTVGIYDGAALLTTLTIGGDGCSYWYISPGLSAGTHSVSARYSGDKANVAGTSAPVALTVNPVPVTLAASCWNPSFVYGGNYQCAVTAGSNAGSPQGAITWSLDGSAATSLALSNGSAMLTVAAPAVGSHQLTISWPQQGNYAAAGPQQETFTVTVAPVVVTLSSSGFSAKPGVAVSFAAAVSSASAGAPIAAGSVTFFDGPTPLAVTAVNPQGQASFTTSTLAPGKHTITAAYGGSSNYGSGSASVSVTIAQSPSSITLTAASTTIALGQAAQLTAAVSGLNPTGSVVFTSGGATLCSSTLVAGAASCSFVPAATGGLKVTAVYQGDANNLGSAASATIAVNAAIDSAISLQFAATTLVYPGATNVTVCVASGRKSPATGTVEVLDGATLLTTQSLGGNGCAYWYISPGLAAGSHSITAVYSGDRNNPAGTSSATAITVTPVPVNLAVALNNASIPYGISARMTVTASSNAGPPSGSITWSLDGGSATSVALTSGNAQVVISGAAVGTHTVLIGYARQTNFAAAPSQSLAFGITAAPDALALAASATSARSGTSLSFSAAVSSGTAGAPNGVGSVSFYDGATLLKTVAVNAQGQASYSTSSLILGRHTITATYAGANYATATASTAVYIAN